MRGSDLPVRELPSGDVCFLFTDVEASTAILRAVGDAEWARLQGEMHAIVRYAVESHGGTLVNTEGDGCFAAFPAAAEGAEACAAAQRVLSRIRWGDGRTVRVRMGLHVGTGVQPLDDDYVALAVHQAARVAAAAHGGQVLATAAVVERSSGDAFTDLGLYSVRDFDGPVRLFALTDPETAAIRPKVPMAFDHELPRYRTALVGREPEIDDILRRLRAPAPLTLTGPAGVGKTRLAVAVLSQLSDTAAVGPWFVDLTTADDPAEVWDLVARSLGCTSSQVDVHLDALLGERHAVLALDNCDHVAGAVATVVQLLTDWNPTLHVLATAGEALGLADEVELRVSGLDLPGALEPAAVLQSAAGRLFVERWRRADTETALAVAAPAIHHICRAVDGLPLAVELAAGLCAGATPAEVAAWIGDRMVTVPRLIERTLGELPPLDRRAVAALALAGQPIGHRLADVAITAVGVEPGATEAVLDGLVRRALLDADPDGSYRQPARVRAAMPALLDPDDRRRVLAALLADCLAVTAVEPVPLSRHEPAAPTAAALVHENALPVRERQQLAAQLAAWWVGRLGPRRARELLGAVLELGRAGAATAAVHLAIADTYEPGAETVETEQHVRAAARLLGEQDAVDPAVVARMQTAILRATAQPDTPPDQL